MALVGADKIAAFGDNRNDILLFSLADRKYAVKKVRQHPAASCVPDATPKAAK